MLSILICFCQAHQTKHFQISISLKFYYIKDSNLIPNFNNNYLSDMIKMIYINM